MTSPADAAHGLTTATPYRRLLGNREVVAMLVARVFSGLGDQVSRAVLALHVLTGESGSALASALVLTVSYVPATFGFAFLASLADRFPRRTVAVVADTAHGFLVATLAWLVFQEAPLAVLLAVLLAAEMFSGPAQSAREAMLPDVARDPAEYQAAVGMFAGIFQIVQVLGFLLGGAMLVFLTAPGALLFDAATFWIAVVLLLVFVRHRPAAADEGTSFRRMVTDVAQGFGEVDRNRPLRAMAFFAWTSAMLLVATDAVALAYADSLGSGPVVATALLAATPAGAAVGALVVGRLPMARQVHILLPLAMASTLPLLASAVRPELVVTWLLWFLAGLLQGYAVTPFALVMILTPSSLRGRVSGFVGAGFNAVAIVTLAALGALADLTDPVVPVVVAGALGLLVMALLWVWWPRRDLRRALRAQYGRESGSQ